MANLQRTTVVTWERDVDPSLRLVAEITDDFSSTNQAPLPAWRVNVRQFGVHLLHIHRDGIADEHGTVHPDLLTAICESCILARPDAWRLVAVRDDLFGLSLGKQG
jgi:hypothetical protein